MTNTLATFKRIADEAHSSIAAFKDDYIRVCEYLSIDISGSYKRALVGEKILSNIDVILRSETGSSTMLLKTCTDLQEALAYESVLDDKDNSEYLSLLRIVCRNKQPLRSLDQEREWGAALGYAKDYEAHSPGTYTISKSTLRENYPKQFDVATAAKDLKKLGCDIKMNDLTLESNGLEKIATSIEEQIKTLGGINVMASLFVQLNTEHHYSSVFRRYLIINPIGMLSHQAKPLVPFGFLLNLCAKHPTAKEIKNQRRAAQQLDEIKSKATLLSTIMGIQHYSVYEVVFQSPSELPAFVAQLALFDSMYSFPSYDPSIMLEYMEHLFGWVDSARFEALFGCTIKEIIAVSGMILSGPGEVGPDKIYASKVIKSLSVIPKDRIPRILGYLSHENGEVNKNYAFLSDYDHLDFGFKPLIRLSPTSYLLCDKSWCAAGFYEAVAAMVRQLDTYTGECNNKIGDALEPYLYYKLSQAGISFSKGKYADGTKPDGEADAVIECEKNILLAELKKKVMTRKSKTGADIDVITDLVKSLLQAQIQAGRTELLLKKQGFVELNDDGNSIRIESNGKSIERIAVTQWEYGSFQDRMVINGLLESFTKVDLHALDKADTVMIRKLKAVTMTTDAWRLQQAELGKTDPEYAGNPFYNSWFLNIPQIVTVLRYCKNNEEFWTALGVEVKI